MKFGVNVLGFYSGNFGLAQNVKKIIECLKYQKIPYKLFNFISNNQSNNEFNEFSDNDDNNYPINIICINPDVLITVLVSKSNFILGNKYNIGLWVWETEDMPDNWIMKQYYFDEIWTVSSFCQKILSFNLNIPVVFMKLPYLNINPDYSIWKTFKEDKFRVLFIFDYLSDVNRKNPHGIIDTYDMTFGENGRTELIIKTLNSDKATNKIENYITRNDIIVINDNLTDNQLIGLIDLCNVYLSLHRSEGFGLTLFEAMYRNKVVIATGYSGNLEFMDNFNSYLINYKIVNCNYQNINSKWADPSLGDASKYLKFLYLYGKDKVIELKPKKTILENWNIEICSNLILSRLKNVFNSKSIKFNTVKDELAYYLQNYTFDENYYLSKHKDVQNDYKKGKINPLQHYINHGFYENRMVRWY